MITKIKPSELVDIGFNRYKSLLEQDFARASKQEKFIDYVFIQGYKFGSQRANLLLFADPTDIVWTKALEKAKENGKKNAAGLCKVLKSDKEGASGITLVIKTAKGDLAKAKVVDAINEVMFKDDFGVEAIMIGDDEDLSDNDLLNKKNRTVSDNELKDGTTFSTDATLKDKTDEESKMTPFVEALDKFNEKIGSVEDLGEETKRRLEKLQGLHKTHKNTNAYKTDVLPYAQKTVEYLNELILLLEDIILKGNYWLKENGDLFAKALRSDKKVERHENKVKETTQQVAQSQKIMRQLIQAKDNVLEKYLKDYSTQEGIYEGQLSNQNRLYKEAIDAYKEYIALEEDQYDLRMAKIDVMTPATEQWLRGSYQSDKHKTNIEAIVKKINEDRLSVEKGLSLMLTDVEGFEEICDWHKAFFKVKGDTLDKLEEKLTLLKNITDKLKELDSKNPAAVQLNMKTSNQYVEVKRVVEKMKADAAIADLLDWATKKGALKREGITADNLFEGFMKKYRGNLAYTPDTGGTVLDGCSNANCQDLVSAFIRVLTEAKLGGAASVVLETYYITTPVDDKWIDPNAGGNINCVDTGDKRYFFSDHWVVEYNGVKYCPTTGRKGKDVTSSVWKKIENVPSGKSLSFDGYKFYNLKDKESKNNGMTYRLEAKK